jgi:ribonuclease HI
LPHFVDETNLIIPLSHETLAVIPHVSPVRENLSGCAYKYFVAYTDGSCTPHDQSSPFGSGGWAAIICSPRGEKWEVSGRLQLTTSNRAELCSLLAALTCVPDGSHLGVQSDSRYVVERVRAGCRAKDDRDNTDLWLEVREIVAAKSVTLTSSWVPGHVGVSNNERADELASVGRSRNSGRRR